MCPTVRTASESILSTALSAAATPGGFGVGMGRKTSGRRGHGPYESPCACAPTASKVMAPTRHIVEASDSDRVEIDVTDRQSHSLNYTSSSTERSERTTHNTPDPPLDWGSYQAIQT
jgi:hypothetical protein